MGGCACFKLLLSCVAWKNEGIGGWRKGEMPLMFQEKMRRVGGRAGLMSQGLDADAAAVEAVVLRRFVGGGLIARFIGLRYLTTAVFTPMDRSLQPPQDIGETT